MERLVLIEIAEDDVKELKVPFTALGIYANNSSAKQKALYIERSAKIKELGEINKKITDNWIKDE